MTPMTSFITGNLAILFQCWMYESLFQPASGRTRFSQLCCRVGLCLRVDPQCWLVFHTVLMLQVTYPPQTNIAMTKTPASAGNTSLKGPCFIAMIVYQSAFVSSRCHGKASQWLVHPGWLGLFFGDESPLKPSYIFILGDENQPTRIPIFSPKCHINIGVSFTLLRSGLHASRCGEDSLHECCRLWSGFKRYHSHWLRHPSCLGWDDGRISSFWVNFLKHGYPVVSWGWTRNFQ